MVFTGKITDSGILAGSPFKVKLKQSLMDSGPGMTIATDRRMKLAAGANGTTTTTTTTATAGTIIATSIAARRGDNVTVSTVQPTTHQKVRRILEERSKWLPESGCPRRRAKCGPVTPSVVNNYSIVASKGELARNNSAAGKTPALGVVTKKRLSVVNGRVRAKEDDSCNVSRGKDCPRLRSSKSSLRAISKSASVPSNLKEGVQAKQKSVFGAPEEGILKRSSAFLANLAHSARTVEKQDVKPEDGSKTLRSLTGNGYYAPPSSSRYSTLKGYFSVFIGSEHELRPLARSPSVQTLPSGRKKKGIATVKKSVSFSSDTSFEEKRAPFRKAAVHEAKVYRKGVLQDRDKGEDISEAKVPPSWDTPSGGSAALLRAARDADDTVLKEIVDRARKLEFANMDVNLADSSGRTAVSYMAGNGAAAMLELALSFKGVDPNLPDNEGNTPLHFAAQAGQTECLNVLLQRCPDIEVDARNTLGFTPLMKAALQGRTKCAKILLFAGANPTLRDHGRGLRAEQWARFCGRYLCAEVIERFARHRLLDRSTSCRWGSEPELAARVLQGKVTPIPVAPLPPPSTGLKSKIRKVFRTTSGPDRSFSLVSQLTSAALCASSPALPKQGDVPPVVKSLIRPLSVPQLRITLVAPQDLLEKSSEKYGTSFTEKIENAIAKPPRTKKKNK